MWRGERTTPPQKDGGGRESEVWRQTPETSSASACARCQANRRKCPPSGPQPRVVAATAATAARSNGEPP